MPIIDGLIEAVINHRICVEPLPQSIELENIFLREVILTINAKKFYCLTNNECGDMDTDNIPLQLSMILMELETYKNVQDFLEWADDMELNAGSATARRLWSHLQKNALDIPKCLPSNLKTVSAFDWHLGAGGISELRALPYRLARPDLHF